MTVNEAIEFCDTAIRSLEARQPWSDCQSRVVFHIDTSEKCFANATERLTQAAYQVGDTPESRVLFSVSKPSRERTPSCHLLIEIMGYHYTPASDDESQLWESVWGDGVGPVIGKEKGCEEWVRPLGTVIQFRVFTLTPERLRVEAKCLRAPLMGYFLRLLIRIAEDWPEADEAVRVYIDSVARFLEAKQHQEDSDGTPAEEEERKGLLKEHLTLFLDRTNPEHVAGKLESLDPALLHVKGRTERLELQIRERERYRNNYFPDLYGLSPTGYFPKGSICFQGNLLAYETGPSLQEVPLMALIGFRIIPIETDRVELRVGFLCDEEKQMALDYLVELVKVIAHTWPQCTGAVQEYLTELAESRGVPIPDGELRIVGTEMEKSHLSKEFEGSEMDLAMSPEVARGELEHFYDRKGGERLLPKLQQDDPTSTRIRYLLVNESQPGSAAAVIEFRPRSGGGTKLYALPNESREWGWRLGVEGRSELGKTTYVGGTTSARCKQFLSDFTEYILSVDSSDRGRRALYYLIEDQDRTVLDQILREVRLQRMEQGEILRIIDAVRRALKLILEDGTSFPTEEINQALVEIRKDVNSRLSLEAQLEASLPVILLLLHYKIALGGSVDLKAVWKELMERVRSQQREDP